MPVFGPDQRPGPGPPEERIKNSFKIKAEEMYEVEKHKPELHTFTLGPQATEALVWSFRNPLSHVFDTEGQL